MSKAFKYGLEHPREAQRLEDQSRTTNYSLISELNILGVDIKPGERILDAGCGTGVLSRQLIESFSNVDFKVIGVDFSTDLLKRAQMENERQGLNKRITLVEQSLMDFRPDQKYSKIFCRYVLQHVPTDALRVQIVKNLLNCLQEGGEIYLIDTYGLFSHLDTKNLWLRDKIEFIENNAPIDLNIGIKLRGFLLDLAIPADDIIVKAIPFSFINTRERKDELKNWEQRFANAKHLLVSMLGELDAAKFTKIYLEEFLYLRTLVLAQKVLVKAKK